MKFMKAACIGILIITLSFAQEEDLQVGNRKFAVDLFKQIIATKPNENVIFSPFTLQTLMAILTTASSTNSPQIQEIISHVKLPSKGNIERKFKEVVDTFPRPNDDFKYFSANKIYFAHTCTVQGWFRTSVINNYKADIETINFGQVNDAAATINNWVAKNTDNLIQNFIKPGHLYNTRMFLINALYLSGKWNIPFETHKTKKSNFHSSSGTKQVDMMSTQQYHYEYSEDGDAQYLKMDLVGTDAGTEMVFVLPLKQQGLDDLLKNKLDSVLSHDQFRAVQVDVTLPKFKVNNDLSFVPMLQNLGVTQIFQAVYLDGYNYYGYTLNTISMIFQKAFIEVDESGVTATSVNSAKGVVDAGLQQTHKVFNADHPFLFYIKVADVIVYAGRVLEP